MNRKRKSKGKSLASVLADHITSLNADVTDHHCRIARLEEKWSRPLIRIPHGFVRFVVHIGITAAVSVAVLELLK